MDAWIYPSKIKNEPASLRVPTSKSLAHRSIICAGLSQGKSIIHDVDMSLDIQATIRGMTALGAKVDIQGNTLEIEGISSKTKLDEVSLDCNESGSTLRFLIPLCSVLSKKAILYGTPKLISRPLSIYQDLFQEDMKIEDHSVTVYPHLKAKHYQLLGNISSQFITGMLFTLPLLEEDSILEILPPFESASYLRLTLEVLEQFGIRIEKRSPYIYHIPGNQTYQASEYTIEGDYSQAAFFFCYGAFHQPLTLTGLKQNSLQGDSIILSILKQMGANLDKETQTIYPSILHGTKTNLEDCPDLGPILMATSAYAKGKSVFHGIRRLRLKESDRMKAMEEELSKFGIVVSSTEDEAIILGQDEIKTNESIDSHNDHRICMAMSILSTVSKNPVKIKGIECIHKSYPNFFQDLRQLGVNVEEQ